MNREPVNPDDPEMTAYALGELTAAEAAEFEARLAESPRARRELAAMREVMSLLGEGLRGEWEAETVRPALRLLEPVASVPVTTPGGTKVVAASFVRPARPWLAAAAGIAILLSSAFFFLSDPTERVAGVDLAMSGDTINPTAGLPPSVSPIHVPELRLAEEIEDLSALDLVDESGTLSGPVDASYLDAATVIPAGFHPVPAGARDMGLDRVDSYLPPIGVPVFGKGVTGSVIERRLGKGQPAEGGLSRSPSVLVSGYVTMEGGESGRIPASFRPVSISANPVVDGDRDLRLYADLNGLKKELSEMIDELPKGSTERADLERILERSERVVSQLKVELSN